jgi:transcriptional regulator with XRE-family HTH domain
MSLHREILSHPEARRAYEEETLYGEATETIAALLYSLQISKHEFAERLGVSPGRVSQILSGKANLTLRTLASMAWALGMHVTLAIEPLANREGTPATGDPSPPEWLARLGPTAGYRFTNSERSLPKAGNLRVHPEEMRGIPA